MFRSLVPNRAFTVTCLNLRNPTIRFRYGASRDNKAAPPSAPGAPASSSSGAAATRPGEAIYDFQIPLRWKRRALSDEEVEYINRGGPA